MYYIIVKVDIGSVIKVKDGQFIMIKGEVLIVLWVFVLYIRMPMYMKHKLTALKGE